MKWLKTYAGTALAVAGAAAAVIATAGCAGNVVSGAIENKIEDRLPQLIGPAKSYRVDVKGPTTKMARGRFRQIDIHGEDVKTPQGLVVGVLNVRLKDVAADTGKGTLESVGETTFDAEVTESSLNDYLARTRQDGMRVRLQDGRMTVWAEPKVLRLSFGVKLTGGLVPDVSRLNFKIDQLQVIGVSVPSIGSRIVEDRINPVVDIAIAEFTPDVRSIRIGPGILRISGTGKFGGQVGA